MKIPVASPDLSGNEAKYVLDAIQNEGRISSSGKYLDRFEMACAEQFGRRFAHSMSNGTVALHLALLSLGIGPGDEVIVPSFTFAASAAVILHCGATPVFVDVREDDWTIDTTKLESVRTPRTKAVIAVDLYGTPCDYFALEDWCKAHNIFLIEDAAEAHGARYNNHPVGSFGDISCFSFFGNKVLTTGEGGVCVMDNPEYCERLHVLKNHGMKRPGIFEHDIAGWNARMTNVQAAMGVAQFERFDAFLAARANNERIYRELLADVPGITLKHADAKKQTVNWMFSILIDKDVAAIRAKLLEQDIETRPLFTPLHVQKPYLPFAYGKYFPVSERLHRQGLSLPSSSVLTREHIEIVCATLKHALKTT